MENDSLGGHFNAAEYNLLDLVGNGGGWLLAAMRLAVMNFVSVVIDENAR